MLEPELAFAGVAGQSELLRRGEVSSRELVELALRSGTEGAVSCCQTFERLAPDQGPARLA